MIYTAVRLGVDMIYWVGRLTIDGTYYMVYGHQETQQEKMEREMKTLETKLESKSMELRKMNQILEKIAEKQGIKTDDLELEVEVDKETVLVN